MGEARAVRARVLIVEDDADVCALVAAVLEEAGYEPVCALGDKAAGAVLRDEPGKFDALVLDIDLGPGVTGFDIARFARSMNPRVPVVFITGGAAASVERFGVPGSALVAKPFDAPLLLSTLKRMLPAAE